MSCPTPVEVAVLADYWHSVLTATDEAAVEEHIFSCDECGQRLREIVALGEGVRKLARQGDLLMVVSDAFLKRVTEKGLRVREYAPPPGGSVQCTVSADDDFLIGHLAADMSRAKRVDLSICNRERIEQFRLRDIPYHAASGRVAFQQPISYAKAAPSETMIARLVGVDEAGGELLLGEYTFIHTRTMPGSGAW